MSHKIRLSSGDADAIYEALTALASEIDLSQAEVQARLAIIINEQAESHDPEMVVKHPDDFREEDWGNMNWAVYVNLPSGLSFFLADLESLKVKKGDGALIKTAGSIEHEASRILSLVTKSR